MIKRVHCEHFNEYGYCKIRYKRLFGFLWYTKVKCEEYDIFMTTCKDAVRPKKPKAPPPPPRRRD